MRYLILMFKGFIIGLAKILPGVSGALLSISLGVYERLIFIIGNPLKLKFDDLKYLFFLMVGAFIGIVFLCNGVMYFLSRWQFATMMLFMGFIIGGSLNILSELRGNFNFKSFLIILVSIIFLFLITHLGNNTSEPHYFLMGAIESLTTIIPGISGTAIFMSLGWYESLLETINGILTFSYPIEVAINFLLGYLISTILVARFLGFAFKYYKMNVYFVIVGFLLSSLFTMFASIFGNDISVSECFFGLVLLIIGYFLTIKLNNLFSKL